MIECAGESLKEMAAFAVVESTEAVRAFDGSSWTKSAELVLSWSKGSVSAGRDGPQKMKVVETKVRG